MCETRARKQPDLAIARDVASLMRTAKQAERRTSGAAQALERAISADLMQHVWIESATPAQVSLGVESAAAAYQVDRALREGGLLSMREALNAPALRVRTRVGRPPGA